MTISPHDLAPGEDASQLGVVARPYNPYLKPEGTLIARIGQRVEYAFVPTVIWEVVGVDVSTWQGRMNWEVTKTLVEFAILRAGHGTSADIQLDNNRTGCAKYSIPFGLYWYVTPTIAWQDISRNFSMVYLETPGKLPPVMDIEDPGGMTKSMLASYVRNLLVDFEQRTSVRPMVYTSKYFWETYLARCAWAQSYRLWTANYTTASQPLIPTDWTKWTLWQNSNKGNGAAFGAQSKYIDLDRYNGTLVQFNQEFDIEGQEPSPPPPVTTGIPMQVLSSATPYLNIREAPNQTAKVMGHLAPGTQFEAKDIGGANAWVQISGGLYDGDWVCVELNNTRFCELKK